VVKNVQVWADGIPCPLTYVGDGQINAILPYSLAGQTTANITVLYNGVASNVFPVTVQDAAPALFSASAQGTGPGAILDINFQLNGASNPAAAGDIVQLYGTGFGVMSPEMWDGEFIADANHKPVGTVTVTIGGQPADISSYAGQAPSLVAGVFQINAKIPTGLAAGPQPIVVTVGDKSSTNGVTVEVK
jgi:uncharacterized protein (TIGR03437 family)